MSRTAAPVATRPSTTWTTGTWAVRVLEYLKAPVTGNNVGKLLRWLTRENGASTWASWTNPYNTRLEQGVVVVGHSPAGFPIYKNLDEAAKATALTLENGLYNPVVANLRTNGSLSAFSAAVVASPWDAGHYGGNAQAISQTPPLEASSSGQVQQFGQFGDLSASGIATGADTSGAGDQSGVSTGQLPNPGGGPPSSDCLVGFHAGVFFGHGPSVCILTRGQGKAIKGAALVTVGIAGMTLMSLAIVAVLAGRTRIGRAASQGLAAAPGPVGTAAKATQVAKGSSAPITGYYRERERAAAAAKRAAEAAAKKKAAEEKRKGDADDQLYRRHQAQLAREGAAARAARGRSAMRGTSHTGAPASVRRSTTARSRQHARTGDF